MGTEDRDNEVVGNQIEVERETGYESILREPLQYYTFVHTPFGSGCDYILKTSIGRIR